MVSRRELVDGGIREYSHVPSAFVARVALTGSSSLQPFCVRKKTRAVAFHALLLLLDRCHASVVADAGDMPARAKCSGIAREEC